MHTSILSSVPKPGFDRRLPLIWCHASAVYQQIRSKINTKISSSGLDGEGSNVNVYSLWRSKRNTSAWDAVHCPIRLSTRFSLYAWIKQETNAFEGGNVFSERMWIITKCANSLSSLLQQKARSAPINWQLKGNSNQCDKNSAKTQTALSWIEKTKLWW